ncbi:thiamine diphosphokinase [Chloroflexota bacterium]
MKVLILVNGELNNTDLLGKRVRGSSFDLVLGADGGAHHASTLGVTLDALIGDMDSFSQSEQQNMGTVHLVSYPGEKNETDLELTLLYAGKQGAEHIVLVGMMGGRMDMTIANILLIANVNLHSTRVEVWHGEQTGWIIKPPGGDVSGHPGDTVSLIPLGGRAYGITTRGLKYPLVNEELTFASVRGISNLLNRPSAHIKLSEGLLLAVHTPGRA